MFPRLAAWWRSPLTLSGTLLFTALLPPCLAASHQTPAVTRTPAVDAGSVRFARSYGWLPVDARRLVLWAGIEEPYFVDLAPGCGSLTQARVSGLTTHKRRLSPHADSFLVDGNPCPVERIQPASGSTLRSLGLRREDARPLPILPIPPLLPTATPPPRKTS